jgi:hypothetical protein
MMVGCRSWYGGCADSVGERSLLYVYWSLCDGAVTVLGGVDDVVDGRLGRGE